MSTQRYSILVVDDDRGVRSVVAELVAETGYDVLMAATLNEAVALARRNLLRASILDMFVRGHSGLELYTRLRSFHAALPAVMMSGQMTDHLRAEALRIGAVSVLDKPLDLEETRRAIQRLLH